MIFGQPGCNSLIKRNKAALVENGDDIEYLLGWKSETGNMPIQRQLFTDLTDDERIIYELISKEGEMNIDSICRAIEMPVYKLSSLLLQMEFNGIIRCYPGNLYRLVN